MRSHVTAFQPISEAARSWSDDKEMWRPSSYFHVALATVRQLLIAVAATASMQKANNKITVPY